MEVAVFRLGVLPASYNRRKSYHAGAKPARSGATRDALSRNLAHACAELRSQLAVGVRAVDALKDMAGKALAALAGFHESLPVAMPEHPRGEGDPTRAIEAGCPDRPLPSGPPCPGAAG